MRVIKEMYPLCCISLEGKTESTAIGDDEEVVVLPTANEPTLLRTGSAVVYGSDHGHIAGGSETAICVAGRLYKWTNFHKGWRSRWFTLQNGVISYSKSRTHPENLSAGDDVRLIGDDVRLSKNGSHGKPTGIVHLKISSFRESKSDDKRFYIFTATKTLHLRTTLKKERAAWIEALSSTRNLFQLRPLNDNLFPLPDVSISTERLKKRLRDEGISDGIVNDCEQIMLSEFSAVQGQLKFLWEERSNLLDTLRQFEASTGEAEASGVHEGEYQLIKNGYSSIGRAKYNEWSTTESSDDVEKQELEEVFEEEEVNYYDTHEDFVEPANGCCTVREKSMENQMQGVDTIIRRTKLPDPVEKEKGVSLWSMIKDNVGKDLTRVCLPVFFNEPISTLQKCFEDLEYSHLLDQAYQHGAAGNSLLRILNVAAFAVSGYSSSEGRNCKPFNPLLGETYEADYPELGMRFFAEKVSHHPTLLACHCEGRGWRFWGDSNLKSKFWGRSIQLDPVGTLTLEFDDGEIFQWNKVTTSIYNIILGKLYCDHHGIMHIRSNRDYSCKLKFKEQSLLERNPHQVHGFVEDGKGKKIATLFGKWNESMHFVEGEVNNRPKDMSSLSLLWKRNMPPENLTRYNLTSFAITLNELTPGLKEKLPPTDSRLRPDQRYLENGEYDKANSEKLRLETRQRMSRKLQEHGWKPRWFKRDGEDGTFRYTGGYWEARERGTWDECPTIFGEISEELLNSAEGS